MPDTMCTNMKSITAKKKLDSQHIPKKKYLCWLSYGKYFIFFWPYYRTTHYFTCLLLL